MYRRFVFVALAVLLAYAPIDHALAGHGTGSHSRAAHASPRQAISPRHHALGSDGSNESYRSLRLQAKSEWRQALHRSTSAPFHWSGPRFFGLTKRASALIGAEAGR